MKIAFILGRFPSLSETFILNQITGLIDAGHQVDIFAKGRPRDGKMQSEIETYRLMDRTRYFHSPTSRKNRVWKTLQILARHLRKNPRKVACALNIKRYGRDALSLRLLYMLQPFLDKEPYDILHCHFGTVGLVGVRLKQMGVAGKLVVTFHGYDISQVLQSSGTAVYEEMFRNADLLQPISEYWQERLIEMGADPSLIQVHRMGIDLRKFQFQQRTYTPPGPVRLLTVGRLVEKKGVAFALQALAQVCRSHPEWDMHYEIIGSGPEFERLEELIHTLGLQGRAVLLGSKTHDEIMAHMMKAHLFLLPSVTSASGDQEGIPVSLMEAMATGMPVLSTHHTGIPELVQHGKSGYLVPEGEVEPLAQQLEVMIQESERWPELGGNGRAWVAARHDVQVLNRQLVGAYDALLANGQGLADTLPAGSLTPAAPLPCQEE